MLPHSVEVVDYTTLPADAHSIQRLKDELISHYSHHRILIMTITLVVFFIATRFLSDYAFPKIVYREAFNKLIARKKRSFVNHHGTITAAILMIALGLYPYMAIVLGLADFSTSIVAGSGLTMGDIIAIATSIFIAVYLHELLFLSSDVPWISIIHHLGAVIVASVMVTINVRWKLEPNTTAYTVLIMTYGLFDVLAGIWPRPVMVIRTVWPEKHRMNMWFCYAALALTVLGTIAETIVAMFLYGVNFSAWPLSVQIAAPICHVLFAVAQGFSSNVMWNLGRRHQGQLINLGYAERDAELGSSSTKP